jgi:hypothetical protein
MSICVELIAGEFIATGAPIAECAHYILMSPNDFNANAQSTFDPQAYDTGFEGVIRMFIAGIGIGAILAFINKLRR